MPARDPALTLANGSGRRKLASLELQPHADVGEEIRRVAPQAPSDAHANLGSLLFSYGRLAEALPHFERAAALKPTSAVLRTNLGSALAASKRYADALREFRRALELRPDYQPALENIARLERMGVR